MEPDSPREHGQDAERQWSPYDEMAANEEAEYRRGRRRRWLLGLGVIALVMTVVAGIAGYILYDRATRTDRSTPVAVVYQYVRAVFTDRDLDRAAQFECDGASPSDPLVEQLRQVEERERKFNVIFIIEATNFETEELGASARVRTDIEFVAPTNGNLSQLRQPWLFELKDEDGWRVCRASKQEQ